MPLQIDVAFLPAVLLDPAQTVSIVVDVIRASTSIVTLFDQGCPAIHVAPSLEAGRVFARTHGLLLCGEQDGARPAGFDYGNSPTEFAAQRFDRRAAVICTTNGTVALRAVAASPAIFVGCLSNATAVVTAALDAARSVGNLTVVCAGSYRHVALDDVWTAGRLATLAANSIGQDAELSDAARVAIALTHAMPDALAALRSSRSARALVRLGLDADVAFAAQEDRSPVAPQLVARQEEAEHPLLLVEEGTSEAES
ncbi:MAG TPA: 2-phosphosulfolactate phosphatase [Chloroflexota bacterium]